MIVSREIEFNSFCQNVGRFRNDFSQDEIKNEPMFFNCDLDFSYRNGGAISRSFIDSIPSGWSDAVIDSRIHMLMPGWYPAIPGFHHDDVPRAPIPVGQHFVTAGQPDYENQRYFSEHIIGLVNGNICPTVFALGKCVMPKIEAGGLVYREWNKEIERLIDCGSMEKWNCPSGELIKFDWQSFHSCQKAIGSGWRWFCRITRNSDRCKTITNEIRKQVQVYLEFPMEGW